MIQPSGSFTDPVGARGRNERYTTAAVPVPTAVGWKGAVKVADPIIGMGGIVMARDFKVSGAIGRGACGGLTGSQASSSGLRPLESSGYEQVATTHSGGTIGLGTSLWQRRQLSGLEKVASGMINGSRQVGNQSGLVVDNTELMLVRDQSPSEDGFETIGQRVAVDLCGSVGGGVGRESLDKKLKMLLVEY